MVWLLLFKSTFNSGSNWYTWLDTDAGIQRLTTEKDDSDFTDGLTARVRITLTTGPLFQRPVLYDWAIFTGPDLFSENFNSHYNAL